MGDDASANRISQELPLGVGGGEDGGPDLISRLPDGVLGDIISLLSTRDGARTQAISRRWRPLWRAAPLNLKVDGLSWDSKSVATRILSEHTGPGRCFNLDDLCLHDSYPYAMVDGWLRSRALTGLREICFWFSRSKQPKPMPPSRFAPTLCVAWFAFSEFPSELPPALNFPHFKKLSLRASPYRRTPFTPCSLVALFWESLLLEDNVGFGRLRIGSRTLRRIGVSDIKFQELVIEDAACLEELFLLQYERVPATIRIRVMQAPKLEIVGLLSPGISRLEFGKTVFREMIALSLTTSMRTVRILALQSVGPNLDSVVDFLKYFPCVDKLYIISYDREKTEE